MHNKAASNILVTGNPGILCIGKSMFALCMPACLGCPRPTLFFCGSLDWTFHTFGCLRLVLSEWSTDLYTCVSNTLQLCVSNTLHRYDIEKALFFRIG